MKHLLFTFLIPVLLSSIIGCSKKPLTINGQIFVVTQSRENIKMGLIPVHVIPDQAFKPLASEVLIKIQVQLREQAQREADGTARTLFIHELTAMENLGFNISELTKLRKEAVGDLASKHLKSIAAGNDFDRATKAFIDALPQFITRTDADGRFSAEIQAPVWMVAYGERSVGSKQEKYTWIIRHEISGEKLSEQALLSNDSNVDSIEELYALLARQAGVSQSIEDFKTAKVSSDYSNWLEGARIRANMALDKAKRLAETEKAEQARLAKETKDKRIQQIGQGAIGTLLEIPLTNTSIAKFCFIPSGTFTMGSPSDESGHSSIEDQVQVTITKSFWLGQTEVTQGQWEAVTGGNPSYFSGSDRLPVEYVRWDDVQAFIGKLNESKMLPAGWKFALPTEAQWEYACRAGSKGPYHGSKLDEIGWHYGNSDRKTQAVARKQANAWGLYDMHGSVWEWCADWYGVKLLV
jgi:formylglycine-generating enzyme required for sulfatase activity